MKQRAAGFTLVELLIAMGIFSIIMVAIMAFLSANQKIALRQQAQTVALTDARSTASYLTEVLSQAIYIYPEKSKIKIRIASSVKEFTTGEQTVAFLTQDPDVSCNSNITCKYDLNLIFLDDRANYGDQVASVSRSDSSTVLVSGVTTNSALWGKNTLPSKDWSVANNFTLGVQAEDVDLTATRLFTADSGFSGYAATDDSVFNGGYLASGVTPTFVQANALINKVAFTVSILPAINGAKPVTIRGSAMGRNIPRAN